LSSADIFWTKEGVLQMWTSALFDAKNSGFFKIYGVSARQGGSSQFEYLADKKWVIFLRFCADVL